MTDLFEEVEEQLRSDRYRTLARKALPWVLGAVGLVLLVVFGYWGYTVWRDQGVATASEQYDAGMEAFAAGDSAKAKTLWTESAKSAQGGYKSLSLMQLGGLEMQADRPAEAVKLFDASAEAAPDEMIADLARLKSAFALLDTAPFKDVEARLTPLIADGRPYRLQAREALAFAKLMAGNPTGARQDFLVLSRSLGAPDGLKARADAAVGLIDSGSAKMVPVVAKQALALPAGAAAALTSEPSQGASAAPQSPANGPQ